MLTKNVVESYGRFASSAKLDCRLVPAALGIWLVSLLGLYGGWFVAAISAGVLALLAVVALWLCRPVPAGKPKALSARRCAAGLLLCCVCSGAAATIVSWRAYSSAEHPVREAAMKGLSATVTGELAADPIRLAGDGYGSQPAGSTNIMLRIRVKSVTIQDNTYSAPGIILGFASATENADLLPGQSIRAFGILAPAHGGDFTVGVLRIRGALERQGVAPLWQRIASDVRTGLRNAAAILGPESGGLLPSLVVGDTSGLTSRVTAEFRAAGMAHLLAVSGTNVAIVCGAVLLLCRGIRLGPRSTVCIATLALIGFVILARPQPSVLRAAVMAGIALLAMALGRTRSAVPALAGTVITLLFVDSELASDMGFLLSVLATAALIVLAPLWSDALHNRGVPIGIAAALAVPAAAALVTAPVVVGMAGELSIISVLANVLVAPVVALATIIGVLVAITAVIHTDTAELLVYVAGPEVWWLVTIARWTAALPLATISWPDGLGGAGLLMGIVILLWFLWRYRPVRTVVLTILTLVALFTIPPRLLAPEWPPSRWALVACDVGQGDAIVLATADQHRAILIDTGPEAIAITSCLRRLGITRIPLIVLTHLHADHIGGLAAVLDDYHVGAVAVSEAAQPAWARIDVQRVTHAAGTPLVQLYSGQHSSWPGLAIEVLAPQQSLLIPATATEATGTAINNASLVIRAHTAAGQVLLTGDIELAGQQLLLTSEKMDLRADIIKVPHHGSRYTLPQFLVAVQPRIALISVGVRNNYGHPSDIILNALGQLGVTILRTDHQGDLAVTATDQGPVVLTRGKHRLPGMPAPP